MFTTLLPYWPIAVLAVTHGAAWAVGKYTYTGLATTVKADIASVKADITAVKAKVGL
jgi:hypothetical protein